MSKTQPVPESSPSADTSTVPAPAVVFDNPPSGDTSEMKVIREMIRHESDFINHRLTWLAALQGFLIASLGVSLKSGLPNRVTVLLAVVGIVSSLSVLVSMFC